MDLVGQKIIWNKGYSEVTLEELTNLNPKFDFICNGDRKIVHVAIKEEGE